MEKQTTNHDKDSECRFKHSKLCRFLSPLLVIAGACALFGVGEAVRNCPLIGKLIESINHEWYMNLFFDTQNSHYENDITADDIVIVDMRETFYSRKNFAEVIQAVADQHPKLICIDVLFQDTKSFDTVQNKILSSTLERIKDSTKLVVVRSMGKDDSICHSFFTKQLDIPFGSAAFYGFGEYVRTHESLPRISLKAAMMLGVDTCKLPEHFYTNFRAKTFDTSYMFLNKFDITDSTSLSSLKNIDTNSIVLIGQTNSPFDIHIAPFRDTGNSRQISGIKIIAYELASILALHNGEKKTSSYPYTFCRCYVNFLLFVLFSFLYYLCVIFFNFLKKRCNPKCKLIKIFLSAFHVILSPILVILFECGVLLCCFFLTAKCFIIPNISLLFLSFAFVKPAYNWCQQISNQNN